MLSLRLLCHAAALDEPTDNVDAKNERAIFQAIQPMVPEHTTLLITYRLSSLEMADELLVLQDGKIQEGGKASRTVTTGGIVSGQVAWG